MNNNDADVQLIDPDSRLPNYVRSFINDRHQSITQETYPVQNSLLWLLTVGELESMNITNNESW